MRLGKLITNKSASGYNREILFFFIKLSLLVSIWFIVYGLLLAPGRIIDRPVTNIIAATVAKCINIVRPGSAPITWIPLTNDSGSFLIQNGKKAFGIWDTCNGIDLMFIYVGVIVLLPFSVKRKIVFSIGGIIAIIIANIIRVFLLYMIFIYRKSAFDFSHHYLFTLLMYVLIFYGWLLFTKKGVSDEKSG